MAVTLLNVRHADPWASALEGLSGALTAFQNYRNDEREFKLRQEEATRRREESESMRKMRDLQMADFEHQREVSAREEDIRDRSEREGALRSFVTGLPEAQPDFGTPALATGIAAPGQKPPTTPNVALAPKPAAPVDTSSITSALSGIENLTPTARVAGRRQLGEEKAVAEARQKAAERGDIRLTPEARAGLTPEMRALTAGMEYLPAAWKSEILPKVAKPAAVKEVDLGDRVVGLDDTGKEVWSRPKGAAPGAGGKDPLIDAYDEQTKKNVIVPESLVRANPERYVSKKTGTASGEGGKPLLAGEADQLKELKQGLSAAADLKNVLSGKGSTGILAQIAASTPYVTQITGWGAGAKSRQATIDLVKQIIGKGLEGGVLRKEDEAKYAKILPTIGDAEEVAKSKIDKLVARLEQNAQDQLSVLESAGRDVTKVRALFGTGAAKTETGPTGDELLFGTGTTGSANDPGGLRKK